MSQFLHDFSLRLFAPSPSHSEKGYVPEVHGRGYFWVGSFSTSQLTLTTLSERGRFKAIFLSINASLWQGIEWGAQNATNTDP
ncbi:MAG: hypothetical protein VX208_08000, partial [SAR324 cluster bacterium]|nr:hypothetical protein [SAR324 cluster bacterium]